MANKEQLILYSNSCTAQHNFAEYCKASLKPWHLKIYLEEVLHHCVFKEEINLVYNTFACFHVLMPDLWTAGKKPSGTVSSFICLSLFSHLTQIWLIKTNVSLWKQCEWKHI